MQVICGQVMAFGKLIKNLSFPGELKFENVMGPTNMAIDPVTGIYWLEFFVERIPILASFNPQSGVTSFHSLPELKLNLDYTLPANQMGVSGLLIDNKGTLWGSFPAVNIGIFNYDPSHQKDETLYS